MKSYQEEMISLESRKIEWLIKQDKEHYKDPNFFRSLVPYMKQLPLTRKLFLRSQFQNIVKVHPIPDICGLEGE
jgi:hypothetical protein